MEDATVADVFVPGEFQDGGHVALSISRSHRRNHQMAGIIL